MFLEKLSELDVHGLEKSNVNLQNQTGAEKQKNCMRDIKQMSSLSIESMAIGQRYLPDLLIFELKLHLSRLVCFGHTI